MDKLKTELSEIKQDDKGTMKIGISSINKLSLETHSYDGYLGPLYHSIIKNNLTGQLLSFGQCLDLMDGWINDSKLNSHQKNLPKRVIELFKRDQNKNGNYDEKNQIHVEDLLPHVINIVKDFDNSAKECFLITFGEIILLGSCPQGRVTRLLCYYIPFIDP